MKVWDKIKDTVRRFRMWCVERFRAWRERRRERRFPKAFPSDTYVEDLHAATKTKRPWVKGLLGVVVLSVTVDIYLLQDSFALMLGNASFLDVFGADGDRSKWMDFAFVALMCVGFIVLYLKFSSMAGSKFSEFKVSRSKAAFASGALFFVLLVIVLALVGIVRFRSVAFDADSLSDTDDTLLETIALLTVMGLGALMSMIRSYYSVDLYAAEKKRLAEAHIPEDRLLYERTYAAHAVDPIAILEHETKERELDRQMVESAFRVCELSTQLNGIVDPADAHDFTQIGRLVRERTFDHQE
ncbi:hypothetical protein [Adlercreutzia caecimuris]|jgi:hypothetical protein|uniref:hypothetical protein n=1 Tax=Adlercreutzia caecimuris TaxID=671266 RepID=UPI0025709188|nr:hypothetical protein [Adlercreutzia caecimuris]